MSLNNTTKSRFMGRVSEFSTRGSRTGANLLGWEEPENLNDRELRDCLTARQRYIDEQLRLLKKGSPTRQLLIEEKLKLQDSIRKLNQKLGRYDHRDLSAYIADIFKERVTKVEWDRVVREAVSRMNESESGEQ